MAKSKSGGTRTYLRGRVGSDVYSIGRDSSGRKQQVVRSLAESVANPQTQSQMFGRMVMSTVMQAVSALRPIIDHSFDGISGKQNNVCEFIRRAYSDIKLDAVANPAGSNKFGLNQYQEKGVKRGQYTISNGQAALPSSLVLTPATGVISITMATDAITVAGLKSVLGMTNEEYFTLVGIDESGEALYERFRVNPTLADTTAISSSNIGDVFAVEGNAAATVAVASNVITITLAAVATCCAVIISKKTASGYIHNKAVLGAGTGFSHNSDAALPTYPVGAENYLNGGDIFGQQESFNPAPTPTPTPTPTEDASIVSLSVAGNAVTKGGSVATSAFGESGAVVAGTVQDLTSGHTYKIAATKTVAEGASASGNITSHIDVAANGAFSDTMDLDALPGEEPTQICLLDGTTVVEVWCSISSTQSGGGGSDPDDDTNGQLP